MHHQLYTIINIYCKRCGTFKYSLTKRIAFNFYQHKYLWTDATTSTAVGWVIRRRDMPRWCCTKESRHNDMKKWKLYEKYYDRQPFFNNNASSLVPITLWLFPTFTVQTKRVCCFRNARVCSLNKCCLAIDSSLYTFHALIIYSSNLSITVRILNLHYCFVQKKILWALKWFNHNNSHFRYTCRK